MAGSAVTVRALEISDLDAVLPIEEASFVQPWARELFAEELAQPTRRYLAAVIDGSLSGYGGIVLAAADAHLLTVAVDPAHRTVGVASLILMELVSLAREGGARHLTLEVRESNHAALGLYRKFGFEWAGTRKGYYTTEDAVVMWAVDIDSVDYERTLDSIRREAS